MLVFESPENSFWMTLGVLLGSSFWVFERSWGPLGHLVAVLEASWGRLGVLGNAKERLTMLACASEQNQDLREPPHVRVTTRRWES